MIFGKSNARMPRFSHHLGIVSMTYSRAALQHTQDELILTYDGERAAPGLIMSSGASPCPNVLVHVRTPRLHDVAQATALRNAKAAEQTLSDEISLEYMHGGRMEDAACLPQAAGGGLG